MKYLLLIISIIFYGFLFSQDSINVSEEMKQILKQISSKAIELGDYNFDFTKEQIDSTWIGYSPATKNEIEIIEKRLGISFPHDYIDFLLITNGFHAANGVDPSLCAINKIDYLKNVDPELNEIWNENKLKKAIKIGGYDEEQYFFLIPPSKENPNWEYWEFSSWQPGETVHNSMQEYFLSVLKTTIMFIENKK